MFEGEVFVQTVSPWELRSFKLVNRVTRFAGMFRIMYKYLKIVVAVIGIIFFCIAVGYVLAFCLASMDNANLGLNGYCMAGKECLK